MQTGWALTLVLPAAVIAVLDWRKGLYAMLVVAFLQDPARKLEADTPVYFTLLAGVVFVAVYLRAQAGRPFWPSQVVGWDHYLRKPSIAFVLLLSGQAIYSLVVYGNPVMAGIGAVSYLAPVPALLFGYHYGVKCGRKGIQRWLTWYVIGALIVLPSVLFEFAGVGWSTLGQVGEGFVAYSESGAELTAHSGFFRASETAAWHAATAVCLLLFLSSMRKLSKRQIVAAVFLVVALLAVGALTTRRKIFVEIAIFLSVYLALLLAFGKGGYKMAAAVLVGGLISYGAINWWVSDQPPDIDLADTARYHHYLERSGSVTADVQDRFINYGLEPIQWAIDRFGLLGGGLGVASQGAQHFGGGGDVYGGAGEGGFGKITAELGVPGLLIVIWFLVAAVRYGWAILVFDSQRSPAVARLAYGLLAFLIANVAVFMVATQLFGDLFILLMLGLVAGFFVATPVLAERDRLQATVGGNDPWLTARPLAEPEIAPFVRRLR